MNASEIARLSRAELNYIQLISTCTLYEQKPIMATLYDINDKYQGLTIYKEKVTNHKISTKTIKLAEQEMTSMVSLLTSDYVDLEITRIISKDDD